MRPDVPHQRFRAKDHSPGRVDRLRLTPRHGLLLVFALATLTLLVVGALASITLLRTSLYQAAEQDAGREARVVTDMGLAAALSHGHLSPRALRIAAAQYQVARHDLPLTGVVIWLPSGQAVFARGSGEVDIHRPSESHIVRLALAARRTRVANGHDPKIGSIVEAAVPLGPQARDAVVEFHFSRSGIQQTLRAAERRIYTIAVIGGLIMYVLILPFLARLARRVPLPVDPIRRAALVELKGALVRHELVVHYQPKAEIESGTIVGVEALVRWDHPRRGLLGPGEFLPLAESSPELLAGLTAEVLEHAIRDCAGWLADGMELRVAVNLAPAVLLHGSPVALVSEALDRHGLDPQMLTLELTESALMAPQEDVTVHLHELRELGVSISIDDFGTGNSSLARLRALPVDELKVDRSFVSGISTDDRDLGITRHIVHLGLEMGLCVVAEGVEDERTLRLLRSLGCEVVQGFHLARPMPEDQLRSWLDGKELRHRAVTSPSQ